MRAEHRDFCDWTDLARAMAATAVAASHARYVLMIDYPQQRPWLPFYVLTSFGHSGVVVFFVLSGFWISRSVLRRIDDASFWPAYLIDRLARLGIVLVPALVLGGTLDAIGIHWLHSPIYHGLPGAQNLNSDVAARLTWPVFLGNLAFLQTIAVDPFGSNDPLWSLAYEFWYYLWFPAIVLTIRHRRLSPALLALLIGLAATGLYWNFASWLVGVAVLLCVNAAPVRPIGRSWVWLGAGLLAAVLLANTVTLQGSTDMKLSISFGLLLLAAARSALPFPHVLAPLAHYGRKASFSLYAIHFPILEFVGGWVVGPARLTPGARSLALVLALTALCLIAGWLFAACTEAYTPRLRGWLRQRLVAAPQPERG